jgi:hypothetical protein
MVRRYVETVHSDTDCWFSVLKLWCTSVDVKNCQQARRYGHGPFRPFAGFLNVHNSEVCCGSFGAGCHSSDGETVFWIPVTRSGRGIYLFIGSQWDTLLSSRERGGFCTTALVLCVWEEPPPRISEVTHSSSLLPVSTIHTTEEKFPANWQSLASFS